MINDIIAFEKTCLNEQNEFLKSQNEKLQKQKRKLEKELKTLKKEHKKLQDAFSDVSFRLIKNQIALSILKYNPIDFDDVWAIVINKVVKENYKGNDFDSIVESVKKYNPSLFYVFY